MKKTDRSPQQITWYFRAEWKALLLTTITGLIYNIGLLANPLFEGKLAQGLLDVLQQKKQFSYMLHLAILYALIIAAVQTARYLKRLYVRKFANNTNRRMKQILYGNLVYRTEIGPGQESTGSVMTKAISDVDACAEGMRKFTTEVFDTGVALLSYIGLLVWYDWKLALLCLIFPPISYVIAEKMKKVVQKSNAACKESAGRLNSATLDRVTNAVTYRVYGCEPQRAQEYEENLKDYEKKAVFANVWVSAMPPLYLIISMCSVVFILWFGSRYVQAGVWDIAMFTTFLSCFARLAAKSSKAAKLFNAVHKAEVSWKRIYPLLQPVEEPAEEQPEPLRGIRAEGLGFPSVFEGLSFEAVPGQIIGITGPVACGKSVLGRVLLGELTGEGSVKLLLNDETPLESLPPEQRRAYLSYMGHSRELFSDTVENNILLGRDGPAEPWLQAVQMEEEVGTMPNGIREKVGSGGIRLSGGQQQRLVLARTMAHPRPVVILDDPFSALDRKTEEEIFVNLREWAQDKIVFLISHRLYLFPQLDGVIWMNEGRAALSDHGQLMQTEPLYADLYRIQAEGGEESDSHE